MGDSKTAHLQIRLTPAQKRAIQRRAAKAGLSVSEWILTSLLPSPQAIFQGLVRELAAAEDPSFTFAEILDTLAPLDAEDFEETVSELPQIELEPYWHNYLAATVEQAATEKGASVPAWTSAAPPLDAPVFGSSLESMRLHLLLNSPPPFAQRKIFIGVGAGGRV